MVAVSVPFESHADGDRMPTVLTFGKSAYRYDVISSTQDKARDWAREGAEPGTIITARAMTAGRGRRGRIWHTPPGANLSLTAIGDTVATDILWQIPLIVGMAVADALTELTRVFRTTVRFPNDVLLGGRKVAGILLEMASVPGGEAIPLIGIGINVAQAPLPPEVASRAISLEEAGETVSVGQVETVLLAHLTRRWQEWRTVGIEELLIAYHAYLDPQARRPFVIDGKAVPCRIVRVFVNGAVLIETEEGHQRAFHAAQVVLGDD